MSKIKKNIKRKENNKVQGLNEYVQRGIKEHRSYKNQHIAFSFILCVSARNTAAQQFRSFRSMQSSAL